MAEEDAVSDWSLSVLEDPTATAKALDRGEVLALDIDPRRPELRLQAQQPGIGDAEVGQRAKYRQWLGAGGSDPIDEAELLTVGAAARAWLHTPESAHLLARVQAGYSCTRYWTGDELGEWSEDAWAAANAIFMGVVAAMEAVD